MLLYYLLIADSCCAIHSKTHTHQPTTEPRTSAPSLHPGYFIHPGYFCSVTTSAPKRAHNLYKNTDSTCTQHVLNTYIKKHTTHTHNAHYNQPKPKPQDNKHQTPNTLTLINATTSLSFSLISFLFPF